MLYRLGELKQDCKLNGGSIRALVDSGATHSFFVAREAQRLNLKLLAAANRVKMVNIVATTTTDLTKGMIIRVGQWCEQLDFFILQMNYFDSILGANFVVKVKVGIFLHYHRLIICRGDQLCFVQGSL